MDNSHVVTLQDLPTPDRNKLKVTMYKFEKDNGVPFLDKGLIIRILQKNIDEGKTGLAAIYGHVNLPLLFNMPGTPLETSFPCLFFPGSTGWFWKNEQGLTHYYSKSPIITMTGGKKRVIKIDLVDIMGLDGGESHRKGASEYLKGAYPFKEATYIVDEKERLDQNLVQMSEYALLYNENLFSYQDIKLFEIVVSIAKEHTYKRNRKKGQHPYFFTSITRIRELYVSQFGEIKRSEVARKMNWFATLGLVNKLGRRDISKKDYETAFMNALGGPDRGKRNMISFYQINTFSSIVKTAERRACRLERKGITVSEITRDNVLYVFGSTLANRVFPVETIKKQVRYADERREYTKQFFMTLKKQGYVTKTQLEGIAPKSVADRLWTKFVKRSLGVASRLNKTTNELLNTEGIGAVFISYGFLHTFKDFFYEAMQITERMVVLNEQETLFKKIRSILTNTIDRRLVRLFAERCWHTDGRLEVC